MRPTELENRLIGFSVSVIKLSEKLKKTNAGNNLSKQIVRSGTSPALNYAEARGAESKKDFNHKLKIVLKELRETHVCLRIIIEAEQYTGNSTSLSSILSECNGLISIFVSSTKSIDKKVGNK